MHHSLDPNQAIPPRRPTDNHQTSMRRRPPPDSGADPTDASPQSALADSAPGYLQLPPRHLLEQHSLSAPHGAPFSRHGWHAASASQSESSQSVLPSQSSSTPSWQLDSDDGGAPQSAGQAHAFSPGSHVPSPHAGGAPQSMAQLKLSSEPSHTRSPQQDASAGSELHVLPSPVQRESPHPTGF